MNTWLLFDNAGHDDVDRARKPHVVPPRSGRCEIVMIAIARLLPLATESWQAKS